MRKSLLLIFALANYAHAAAQDCTNVSGKYQAGHHLQVTYSQSGCQTLKEQYCSLGEEYCDPSSSWKIDGASLPANVGPYNNATYEVTGDGLLRRELKVQKMSFEEKKCTYSRSWTLKDPGGHLRITYDLTCVEADGTTGTYEYIDILPAIP